MRGVAVFFGACFTTLCTGQKIWRSVTDMLDLDTETCSEDELKEPFRELTELSQSCVGHFNMLEGGMNGVAEDGWERNIARNAVSIIPCPTEPAAALETTVYLLVIREAQGPLALYV